ncbi:MAG: hypothetical protein GWN31_11210 [Candidatus Thorarchaeota archaeon]|nr:hypothetical protein [Candidatus Thorarchaeota archaeon]NIW14475.1 hypothetical protein [Candidatus Thorarchaeota archaeon]NIW52930.1 hypothetical protein [Candidatus Korarchaeota archaeon]
MKIGLFQVVGGKFTFTIPSKVKEETVDEGKQKGYPDAYKIEEEINKGRIKVRELDAMHRKMKEEMTSKFRGLGEGEIEAISLADQEQVDLVSVDDEYAFKITKKLLGIPPVTSGSIAVRAVEIGLLPKEEGRETILNLKKVGLSPEYVYEALEGLK